MMLLIITAIARTLQHAVVLCVVSSVLVSAACYYPDGGVSTDTPCTDSTGESTCCQSGYACLGHVSGYFLCQATGKEFQQPDASPYVRGSCTDKTWRSANCPNKCVTPNRDNTSGGHGIDKCPQSDTLFYCISDGVGVENCTTGFELIDFGAKPSVITTIGFLPSTTSSSSATSSTGVSTVHNVPSSGTTSHTDPAKTKDGAALKTSPPPASSSSSSGTTIGIAVGVSIGVLALLGAGLFAWFLVRKRRGKESLAGGPSDAITTKIDPNQALGGGTAGPPVYGNEQYKHGSYVYTPAPSEVPANEHVAMYELPGVEDHGPRELDPRPRGD